MKFKMLDVRVLLLFIIYLTKIKASTHWIVTEEGLIKPRTDSPFEMARPYDLLGFLSQDKRWDNIINWYQELADRQKLLEATWLDLQKNCDITSQIDTNENCRQAGPLDMLDWYASIFEDGNLKGIPEDDYLLNKLYKHHKKTAPDCKKLSSLTFSMFTFEHLESIMNRENLTAEAEMGLPDRVTSTMTLDQFGHWLSVVLKSNTTSWLHYNMAALYWRAKGNPYKALECCRRAVHYAPRYYRDISLLNMGIILHRSKKTKDALIVLGAAVDHDPMQYINHYVLGSAHAVVGNYNSALECFDKSLKVKPEFWLAFKHRLGVLCHSDMRKKVQFMHKTLIKLRHELKQYSQKEALWLKAQAAFLRTMKHKEEFDYRNVEKNCAKMSQLTGLNISEQKKFGDKTSLINYFIDQPMYNNKWEGEKGVFAVDSAVNIERMVNNVLGHASLVSQYVVTPEGLLEEGDIERFGFLENFETKLVDNKPIEKQTPQAKTKKKESNEVEEKYAEINVGEMLYPPTMKVSRNTEDFDTETAWPTEELCNDYIEELPNDLEYIHPVFIPFENKGISINKILTEKIGVPLEVEHELPWHPPVCTPDKNIKKLKQQIQTDSADPVYLREKLLEYVGNGNADSARHLQIAEIGQRIYLAMNKGAGPPWVLHALAGLYWAARSCARAALACLARAGAGPAGLRDAPLAALASTHLALGHFDEALAAAEEAYKINAYEPATNWVLAELSMVKQQRGTQMFHMKQALRVQPSFMGGQARHLLLAWACKLSFQHEIDKLYDAALSQDFFWRPRRQEINEGDLMCTQVEPSVSVLCDKVGESCRVAQLQCVSRNTKSDASDGSEQGSGIQVLHALQRAAPPARASAAQHTRHYRAVLRALRDARDHCGPDCVEQNFNQPPLKEEDCTYQKLQLEYWLHVITFQQLRTDPNLRLPPEITSMTPSNNKIPNCPLPETEDFFIERLTNVDTEGWVPLLGLMQQLAEIFDSFDYVELGAKIAKYVDTNWWSWRGLVAAGWWCGAAGRGACAARCLSAAHARAPLRAPAFAPRALAALLHMQSKQQDAKEVAYLTFYMSPMGKIEAFLVAVSHTYLEEYPEAVWMYRYALSLDPRLAPARACLRAALCLLRPTSPDHPLRPASP